MTEIQQINLERLEKGVCSYSPRRCAHALEAALVCLHNMGHGSEELCEEEEHCNEVYCRIDGWWDEPKTVAFQWKKSIDQSTFDSWDDLNEAVEEGATGIAFALIDEFTDFDLIKRAEKGRGVDFYLGYRKDFQLRKGFRVFSARLEVSGILAATAENSVARRVKVKLQRTEESDIDNNPAHVIVAEFSEPMVNWSKRTP